MWLVVGQEAVARIEVVVVVVAVAQKARHRRRCRDSRGSGPMLARTSLTGAKSGRQRTQMRRAMAQSGLALCKGVDVVAGEEQQASVTPGPAIRYDAPCPPRDVLSLVYLFRYCKLHAMCNGDDEKRRLLYDRWTDSKGRVNSKASKQAKNGGNGRRRTRK